LYASRWPGDPSVGLSADSQPAGVVPVAGTVHSFNDCSDRCTTRTQRALSLRIGPQIQTLLSWEGRRRGGCRTGRSRSGKTSAIVRRGQLDAQTRAKATTRPALEGDLDSWLHPAVADATQGRWGLSVARPAGVRIAGSSPKRSGCVPGVKSEGERPVLTLFLLEIHKYTWIICFLRTRVLGPRFHLHPSL
jgi:hypothetical protein